LAAKFAADSNRTATQNSTALTPSSGDVTKNRPYIRRKSLAVHPSVIKRHHQSLKRRARNIEMKSKLRTLIKKARQAIESKNIETISIQLRAVNKALGNAVSKGVIKNNTASRWLSRLSRAAAQISTAT
jgi:small subunit ribosomal protein S20